MYQFPTRFKMSLHLEYLHMQWLMTLRIGIKESRRMTTRITIDSQWTKWAIVIGNYELNCIIRTLAWSHWYEWVIHQCTDKVSQNGYRDGSSLPKIYYSLSSLNAFKLLFCLPQLGKLGSHKENAKSSVNVHLAFMEKKRKGYFLLPTNGRRILWER